MDHRETGPGYALGHPRKEDSCDTLGASWTTDGEDEYVEAEGCVTPVLPAPGKLLPRSPCTPQAQIVKNNFKVSYRRIVSGANQSLSYRSEFISPEIIRDGKHGLFTHFEDREPNRIRDTSNGDGGKISGGSVRSAIWPPSTSPKQGEMFLRTSLPSPAMRVRKLRLSFQDSNTMAYYDHADDKENATEGIVEEKKKKQNARDANSAKTEGFSRSFSPCPPPSSTRREVRGKLSFPHPQASATPMSEDLQVPREATPTTKEKDKEEEEERETGEVIDQKENTNRFEVSSSGGSPVSVFDRDRCAESSHRVLKSYDENTKDVPSSCSKFCCELCGQNLSAAALAKICNLAIPQLQRRGRYLSLANGESMPVGSHDHELALTLADGGNVKEENHPMPLVAAGVNSKRNAEKEEEEEEEEELTQPVAMLAPTSYWLQHKRRSKAQKKIWRSFGQQGRNAIVGGGMRADGSPTSFLQLQQYQQGKSTNAPFSYTPVKDLIYHQPEKKRASGNLPSYMDVNAATFLFASQMKLTLNG